MNWHKVEDYPVGSDEYVLVSMEHSGKRDFIDCFVAKKANDMWHAPDGEEYYTSPTDKWAHIELPDD